MMLMVLLGYDVVILPTMIPTLLSTA